MIDIYKAKKSDASAVQLCCNKAFKSYIPLIGKNPAPMNYNYLEEIAQHTVFVASDGLELVGFVLIRDGTDDYMWMEVLAVDPDFSGKGIGRMLISHCEHYILQSGKKECRLYTNIKFERTCNIYLRLGYEIYETVCKDGYQRHYMKKRLTDVAL